MLTGSMALNHYAQPRMTRDIDIVLALLFKDLDLLPEIFDEDFYYSPEAARQAILYQSIFNDIHNETLIKDDFMIRELESVRRDEVEHCQRFNALSGSLWLASKEYLTATFNAMEHSAYSYISIRIYQ